MPEWIVRDFTGGMHINPTRDAIAEQDLWWMENLQPLASGNVSPLGAFGFGSGNTAATYNGVAGLPYYSTLVNLGSLTAPSAFIFTCMPDGSAWLTPVGGTGTQIMAPGTLSGTSTYAVGWTGKSNPGLLIIDPNGYWDYNLTTLGTLTALHTFISTVTNVYKTTVAGGTPLRQSFISGTINPPGQVQAHYTVTSCIPLAGGAGYVLGDVLSLTDGNPVTECQVTVTNVGGGGAITGVSINQGGDYPGPSSTVLVATGPTGTAVSGGTGTGATFTVKIQAFKMVVVTPGPGTTNPVSMSDQTAAPVNIDIWNFAQGNTSGTSIATYAGRVWVGNGPTLSYTDVNSYNYFGNAGGQATFSDQYLTQGITVLYPINNYLYVFGAISVDIISNVSVNATTGVTSFSRVNVLQGIGCIPTNNMTVIGFGRGIVFLDVSGLYMLAGATPERMSERIQAAIRAGLGLQGPSGSAVRPSCGTCTLNNELCLALQFEVADAFSHPTTQATRTLVFMHQRHRWWVASDFMGDRSNLAGYDLAPLAGQPNLSSTFGCWRLQSYNNLPTWTSTQLGTGDKHWQLRTKLWDGGKNFSEKQAINVGLSAVWTNPNAITYQTGVTFTVDSELQNANPPQALPNIPTLFLGQGTYNAPFQGFATQILKGVMAQAQAYGSQYIGLTYFGVNIFGVVPVTTLEGISMRGKQERNMLE